MDSIGRHSEHSMECTNTNRNSVLVHEMEELKTGALNILMPVVRKLYKMMTVFIIFNLSGNILERESI